MATLYRSITPTLKNTAYTFYISLTSQADTDIFQTSVTLAVGDIKVSGDGGGFSNITANPPAVEIGTTGVLAVTLTNAEMNYDQCVMILFHDAAGSQWQDCLVMIDMKEPVTVSDLTQAQILSDATPFPGADIDASISTRLASAGYTAPPTAAANADAIADELLSGHVIVGSAGAAWAAAGSAADPLENDVPGTYASGTAGHALGRIGSGQITTVSPVAQNGDVEVTQGYTYSATDGYSLDWTDTEAQWPVLTGAVITVEISGYSTTYTGSVVTATGASKKVRLELIAAQTLAMAPINRTFQVKATLLSGSVIPLVEGQWVTKAAI